MKAMIFAAGLGTRLLPLTAHTPKALIKVGGKTLLERSIAYLKKFGVDDIVVNIHHFPEQIRDFLQQHKNFGVQIRISDESDHLLDTGGGILHARHLLEGGESILLINVDILTNMDLGTFFRCHEQTGALASLAVRERSSSRYLLFDRKNRLSGWQNTSTGELRVSRPATIPESVPLAFSGIHLIRPELLSKITESGKFSIIDLYLRLSATENIASYRDQDSIWMDLGKYGEIMKAEELIRQMEQ